MRAKFDMAAAVAAVHDQPASELTLRELVTGYSKATLDGSRRGIAPV
jgi:hypothetical protein